MDRKEANPPFWDRGQPVLWGVYINDHQFHGLQWSYEYTITHHFKHGETRPGTSRKPSFSARLLERAYRSGERIAIVVSGTGDSYAYATTKIGKPEFICAKDWDKRRCDTQVPVGSDYDLKEGQEGKWYYPFVELHVLDSYVRQSENSPFGAKF